jgi:hypothetical protein
LVWGLFTPVGFGLVSLTHINQLREIPEYGDSQYNVHATTSHYGDNSPSDVGALHPISRYRNTQANFTIFGMNELRAVT